MLAPDQKNISVGVATRVLLAWAMAHMGRRAKRRRGLRLIGAGLAPLVKLIMNLESETPHFNWTFNKFEDLDRADAGSIAFRAGYFVLFPRKLVLKRLCFVNQRILRQRRGQAVIVMPTAYDIPMIATCSAVVARPDSTRKWMNSSLRSTARCEHHRRLVQLLNEGAATLGG